MELQTPQRQIQPSFAGGELSPALAARVDIAKYGTGLKTARNATVLPQGGIRNRAGTKMIAQAGNGLYRVRLIPFVASTTQSFMLEFGQYYIRFYIDGGQVQMPTTNTPAWVSGTAYFVGQYVLNSGTQYYCLVANTASSSFSNDLAAGYWEVMNAYQIPSPYAGADVFNVKFAQSADVLFMAHSNYAPQMLTFYSLTSWNLAPYPFVNGPFMIQNTNQTSTVTPQESINSDTLVPISLISSGPFSTDRLGPGGTGGGPVNSITITTSTDHNLTTGDLTTISGMTGTPGSGFNNVWGVYVLSPTTFLLCEPNTQNYIYNAAFTSYNPGGDCTYLSGITINSSLSIFNANDVGDLFQIIQTIDAQTQSLTITSGTTVGASIQCGSTYQLITTGGWTGNLELQASNDNGNTWNTIQTLQSTGSDNYNISGDTGFSQCLIRLQTYSGGLTWAGTLYTTLQSNSFDWIGVVKIATYINANSVTAFIQSGDSGGPVLANTSSTWQWSKISWGIQNGYPSSVTFYQDRLCWASTSAEPQTIWMSKTSSYFDFGVSEPTVASDSMSIVLPSRQLNAIQSLVVMPQALVALTSDSEWSIAPASSGGGLSATNVNVSLQGHRGSANIDPAIVGIEMILMQAMGTIVRNLNFQLVVNGFFGQNISIESQHLFTGYSIIQMAYSQEPDSIIYFVRSDGTLITLTYSAAQQMNAFTRHDTLGLFESVATLPNLALGWNEVWVVVNRNGTRFIEKFVNRDTMETGQGINTDPADQFFVDCGISFDNPIAITDISFIVGTPGYFQVTAPNHGFSNGQLVDIDDFITPVNLPINFNYRWVVANATTNTFQITEQPNGQSLPSFPSGATDYGNGGGLAEVRACATIFSGISYLNGYAVSVFADGNVIASPNNPAYSQIVVANGQITLPFPASRVHVGLPYVSDVETLKIEVPQYMTGTLQGRRAKIPRITCRFWNTRGGFIGPDESLCGLTGIDGLDEIETRPESANFDSPIPLQTRDFQVTIPGGYDYGAHLFFRQIDPLPFIILAFIQDVVAGGE